MTPWKIRRDGTVVLRESGEVIGTVFRVVQFGTRWGTRIEWEYLPPRCRSWWRPARTRSDAARALYDAHTRREKT